jgi:hypothetical protein
MRSHRTALYLALVLGILPRAAFAQRHRTPPPIALTYRGGPLLSHVRVATLFWGSAWGGSSLAGYFNGFFGTLFADGRFMANLAQYSVSHYPIGNGTFAGTVVDTQQPPGKLHDAQIQTEIRSQITAGHLPKPDANTVYFVFTPPGVEAFDRYGSNSVDDFYSYHDYASGSGGFPYAVIPYDNTLDDPRLMTIYASHELAEVVTDPAPSDRQLGWYDDYYGEVADVVDTLYDERLISEAESLDSVRGSNGSVYVVTKVWSAKDGAPVAFAS